MTLSVIIVNWNSLSFLEKCIESLNHALEDTTSDITVVDNKSSAEEVEKLRSLRAIKLLENNRNIGFASACNKGYKAGNGEYVLFLNPDTLVKKDSITKMLNFLSSHKEIGMLGPKLTDRDGRIQRSCYRYPNLISEFFLITGLNRLFPNNFVSKWEQMSGWSHDSIRDVEWVSGAALMSPRAVLEKIGLFDENMFMYREDMDLCDRARKAGYKVVYFPDSEICHYEGGSSDKKKGIDLEGDRLKSIALFFRKKYGKSYALFYILTIFFVFNIRAFLLLPAIFFSRKKTYISNKLRHYLRIARIPLNIAG